MSTIDSSAPGSATLPISTIRKKTHTSSEGSESHNRETRSTGVTTSSEGTEGDNRETGSTGGTSAGSTGPGPRVYKKLTEAQLEQVYEYMFFEML